MTPTSRRDQAFEDLVQSVCDPLFRTTLLLCGDWQYAEDLVQMALVKLYVRGHWRQLDHPLAYLRRIVVNEFINLRRRRSAYELPVEDVLEHTYGGWKEPDPEARIDLFRALARLPVTDRAVVVLRYWDDLSVNETAALVGLSPGAVRVRSVRALARLRQSLTNLPSASTTQENDHEPQPANH